MKELIRLLSDEIKRNNQNISISEDRMITVLNNGLTGKVLYKFLLSIIPYFVLLALVVVLARMGILSSLESVVSPTFLNIGIVAGSFGIGSLLHSIMVKRNYTKEELRGFTSANKLDELTLEEVNLKIEQQKGKNRNIVIEEVLSFLKSNSNMQTNSNYYFSNELKRIAVRKFLDGLKKDLENLDVVSIKQVLNQISWKQRFSKRKFGDALSLQKFCVSLFFSALFINAFGLLAFFSGCAYSLMSLCLLSGLSIAVGTGGSILYLNKRNKDYMAAFDKINAELGSEALTKTYKDEYGAFIEKNSLEKEIQIIIEELTQMADCLKMTLMSNSSDDDSFEQELARDYLSGLTISEPFEQKSKSAPLTRKRNL